MNKRYGRWLFISLVVVISIISAVSIEVLSIRHQYSLQQLTHQKANEQLSTFRYKLEARIFSDIYIAKTLATLTTVNADSVAKHWDSVARGIITQSHDISSVAIAPNDVIQYVYPYEENKAAIGTDFRSVPEQWATVSKARTVRRVYLAGPVNLVQGGVALIARYPVFLDPPDNQFYWGVVSVVLDIKKLFSETGLESLQKQYEVAIRGKDSKGPDGDVFVGDSNVFVDPLAIESVYFPYGSWSIAVTNRFDDESNGGWAKRNSVRLVGYPILILFMVVLSVVYFLYSKARWASLYDELTQLPNRRFFMEKLERAFTRCQMTKDKDKDDKSCFALINIDLNDFKEINDVYGHLAGDIVLAQTASRIIHSVRPNDFVSRIGGDEFLVMLFQVNSEKQVVEAIERIRRSIVENRIDVDGTSLTISASLGFALYSDSFKDAEDMMIHADVTMYEEKKHKHDSSPS
ncbi:sensor domain-containing diguanylate cyclase [Vibrio sp.]|nr:sensor domain-containing diguanylate cyclase [Vibrio sp.]